MPPHGDRPATHPVCRPRCGTNPRRGCCRAIPKRRLWPPHSKTFQPASAGFPCQPGGFSPEHGPRSRDPHATYFWAQAGYVNSITPEHRSVPVSVAEVCNATLNRSVLGVG